MMEKLVVDLKHKFNQWNQINKNIPEIIRYTGLVKNKLNTWGSIHPKGILKTKTKDIIHFYITRKGFIFKNVEDDFVEIGEQLLCEWLVKQQ